MRCTLGIKKILYRISLFTLFKVIRNLSFTKILATYFEFFNKKYYEINDKVNALKFSEKSKAKGEEIATERFSKMKQSFK